MCNFIIYSLYSNIEYDIIIGVITDKIGNSNSLFKIGDTVLFFPDNIHTYSCINDPFLSYYIDEEYIFKISESDLYSSYLLPIFKYNCVCYIIKSFISPISKIKLYSNYNINCIINKLISNMIEWHPINEFNDNLIKVNNIIKKNEDDVIIYISPLLWKFYINNDILIYDLTLYNILYIFGINNIKFIINSCLKNIKNIKIFINSISFSDISNNQIIINNNKKTKFFNILKFN